MAHAIRVYGSISKVTKQDDGTLIVEGIASTESVDSQGEVVKADAMRAALPDFMKFANVREMHQPIAAGKAIECTVDDAGVTHISAHIVDIDSCKKVEAGVLQGFSIGGRATKRSSDNAKVIEGLKLSEISLVDRPANPDALITLFKMDVAEPVEKGMYQVAWAAHLCGELSALSTDAQFEADFEGDSSPVPARIKAVVAELCSVLRDLVAEETAELVGDAGEEVDVVGLAEKPGALKKSEKLGAIARAFIAAAKGEPIEKKGAKFSKATADAIADIHKCVKDAHEKLGALGYDKDSSDAEDEKKDDVGMAAQVGELQKRAADSEAALAKAEEATKLAGDALKKVLAEREALTKRLSAAEIELKKKGSLKGVPISKSDDAARIAADAKPIPGATGEAAEAASLLKAVHAAGGNRIL